MRIYFDELTNTVLLENLSRYKSGGALEAAIVSNNVSVRYTHTKKWLINLPYTEIFKEDGSLAGTDNITTIDYLNLEFNKSGLIELKNDLNNIPDLTTIFNTNTI